MVESNSNSNTGSDSGLQDGYLPRLLNSATPGGLNSSSDSKSSNSNGMEARSYMEGGQSSNLSSPDSNFQPNTSNADIVKRMNDDRFKTQSTELPIPDQNEGEGNKRELAKKFFCKTCNQGFTRKHNMVSHELIHSSLRPHVCSVCNMRFRRIHDLKRHEKLHTGEKPFVCDRCSRGFARPDALSRHQESLNACSKRWNRTPFKKELESGDSNSSNDSEELQNGSNHTLAANGGEKVTTQPPPPGQENVNTLPHLNFSPHTSPVKHLMPVPSERRKHAIGLTDPANQRNFDVKRLKPQHYPKQARELPPHPQIMRYPYYTTTTTTTTSTTTYDREKGRQESQEQRPHHLSYTGSRSHTSSTVGNRHNNDNDYNNELYVSMSKYNDLVLYTQKLQDSLNRMNARIEVLEKDPRGVAKSEDPES